MPHAARTDLRPEEWADEFGLYLPDETTPYPPDRLPLARVRGGEVVNNVEIFVRHADAPEGIWVSVNGRPLQDSEGNRVGGVIVIRDITTDKFAESALLAGQEMERKRISRELHDSVSQSLSALILETEIIKQELPESETAPRGVFDSHINRLQTLDEDISRVARQLHPSLLERFGLVAALQQLSDEITRRGELAVDFSFQDVPSAIVRSSELCLYRVAQEALRNVARHAGARQATLSLQGECGRLILCVEDQGAGFDLDAVAGKARLGLVNMRERVRIAGGSLSIHSRPGRGTRIEVQVPAMRAANVQAH
jgi:signal transduction histidine kinase